MFEKTLDRPGSRISQSTNSSALNLVSNIDQLIQIFGRTGTGSYTMNQSM
jgi:hypothetical protein